MISMSKTYSIRQLRKQGDSVAEIARKVGVCRNTVYSCLANEDLSPKMPIEKVRAKLLDPYRPLIISWIEEDRCEWRKQRHTAHRIWVRLTTEEGVRVSESTVRAYVRALRSELPHSTADGYLDLIWAPGEAQADFGEADFYVRGVKVRMSYFVLTFPYSNIGIAQVFPSENAECVCQALKNIFEFIGGVPLRIVFDNATGVGRRICEKVRTTELFAVFSAHYNFAFTFCNPDAGHEKGSVEAKVRYIRANLFVPVPRITDPAKYNAKLLCACMALSKDHYLKGEPEKQLFIEDRFAMAGLPEKPFDVVRYERPKADKKGKVKLDGPHYYSSDPSLAGRELIAAMRATSVELYTASGEFVCGHARAYGKAPTDTEDPASQLALLAVKAGGWRNSQVRFCMPDRLREHMDSLSKPDLRAELRVMRDQNAISGWDATVCAMDACFAATGRIDAAGVSLAAARALTGDVSYDEKVDLDVYDRALGIGEVV